MTVFNTKYIRSLLPNRLDSRSKNESRPLDLTFTSTSVTTTLGQTKILATTSAEIARPSPSNPSEGNIIFDISFPGSLNNGIDDRQLHIAALLETALKKSKAVDVEGLCLVAGEKVWNIRVDMAVLDDQGNVTDAACIAAISSLLHFRIPQVSVDGDGVVVHDEMEKSPVPLSIHHIPIATTFVVVQGAEKEYLVCDPSCEEEAAGDASVCVVVNVHGQVCAISKAGGALIDLKIVKKCVEVGAAKAVALTRQIKDAVNTQKR